LGFLSGSSAEAYRSLYPNPPLLVLAVEAVHFSAGSAPSFAPKTVALLAFAWCWNLLALLLCCSFGLHFFFPVDVVRTAV